MLYIVATPIGNLKDVTYRAIEVLNNCDYIACEDTRTSYTFLSHYNIDKKLVSYHKFNEASMSDKLINDLKEGKDIALISDAGMPGISDPGSVVIRKVQENKLDYTVLPGPSALINAVVLSGYQAPFTFVGFLPDKNKDRKTIIDNIKDSPYPTIYYVSPHSIDNFFSYMFKELGDREVCVVRELTKKFETVSFTTLEEGYSGVVKGEFVIIVKGCKKAEIISEDIVKEELNKLLNSGITKKTAVVMVSEKYNLKKNFVYNICNTIED